MTFITPEERFIQIPNQWHLLLSSRLQIQNKRLTKVKTPGNSGMTEHGEKHWVTYTRTRLDMIGHRAKTSEGGSINPDTQEEK